MNENVMSEETKKAIRRLERRWRAITFLHNTLVIVLCLLVICSFGGGAVLIAMIWVDSPSDLLCVFFGSISMLLTGGLWVSSVMRASK